VILISSLPTNTNISARMSANKMTIACYWRLIVGKILEGST
jgi:hypothetical protein